MGQKLFPDRTGTIQKNSSTQVQLNLSTFGDIRATLGGQQYSSSTVLQLNTGTVGFGGVDVALQNWKLYYVYAVLSGSTLGLIASTNAPSVGPSGYTQYSQVAYFDTDGTPMILSTNTQLFGSIGDEYSAQLTESQLQALKGPGWILQDGRNVVGSAWATLTSNTTIPDARGIYRRGKNNGRSDGNQDPSYTDTNGSTTQLGTFQGDQMQGHIHTLTIFTVAGAGGVNAAQASGGSPATDYSISDPYTDGTNGTPRSGLETRAKGVITNNFIKVN